MSDHHNFNIDKCRICLEHRKKLCTAFESDPCLNITYADMITSIANIKIIKDSGIPDKICSSCRRKLSDLYNFKKTIVESDILLHQTDLHLKRIIFSDINDIKIEIELLDTKKIVTQTDYSKINFKEGEDLILYNNTTIKKINIPKDDINENKPLSVLEFLETIKDEDYTENNESLYRPDSDNDDEYIPELKKPNKSKVEPKLKLKKKSSALKTGVYIKPVIMKDLKILHAELKPRNIRKHKLRQDICPVCGKLTKSIQSHLLVHTGDRKYKCNECSKGFFREKDLSHHQKRHTNVKDFKCDKCVASFYTKTCLQSHMTSHLDVKNYVCDICSKAFKRKHALYRHAMMHNSANKCIKCDLCNMSFYNKCNLNHHMRVHTGERPYKCEICSQPYSYKHDFNRHCLKKHGVFLKRRSDVSVMNEEVIKRERELMRDLMLRMRGVIKDGKPLNPFKGPQAALAFEQAVKALKANQIPIDL